MRQIASWVHSRIRVPFRCRSRGTRVCRSGATRISCAVRRSHSGVGAQTFSACATRCACAPRAADTPVAVTLSSAPAPRPLRGEGRPVAAAAGGSIGERSLRVGLKGANRQLSPGHTEAFKLPWASVRAEHSHDPGDSVESQAPGGRASAESQALGEPLVGCQAVMPLLTCGAERHRRPEAAAGGPCGTRVPSRGRLAPDEGACMSHALARCIRANVCVRWSRCAMHVHAVSKVDACRCVPGSRTRVHACKRLHHAWCMCSS